MEQDPDPWEPPPGPIREALGDAVDHALRRRSAAEADATGRHRSRRRRWRRPADELREDPRSA